MNDPVPKKEEAKKEDKKGGGAGVWVLVIIAILLIMGVLRGLNVEFRDLLHTLTTYKSILVLGFLAYLLYRYQNNSKDDH